MLQYNTCRRKSYAIQSKCSKQPAGSAAWRRRRWGAIGSDRRSTGEDRAAGGSAEAAGATSSKGYFFPAAISFAIFSARIGTFTDTGRNQCHSARSAPALRKIMLRGWEPHARMFSL
jgi:hypothetical protein